MADRYWVGGTGTWSSTNTTNWSTSSGGAGGASVPTAADNVIFDAGSDAGGTFVVTMANTPRVCNDFTASGLDFTMTLAGSNIGLTVSGSLEFPATNFNRAHTGTTTFNATTTGKTITTNGVEFRSVTFNGVGGEWTLGSAFSCGPSGSLTFTNGTIDTSASSYAVTAGRWTNNGSSVTVNLNGSTITLTFSTAWSFLATATLNAGTSTIRVTSNNGRFTGGGKTYHNVEFSATQSGSMGLLGTGVNTLNNLTIATIGAAGISSFVFEANQTINGTFTVTGSDGNRRIILNCGFNVVGTTRTLTCAAIAATTDVDFRDITIAGAAAPLSGTRLGDCGGNSGITFGAGVDKYWNLAAGGNWNSTAWATSSGGAVANTNFPLVQDTVIIENTGLNTSAAVTINANYNIGNFDMSTRSNAMTLSLSGTVSFYENLIYNSAITNTGTANITFINRSIKTFDSAGKTFDNPITINAPGGGVQLINNNFVTGSLRQTLLFKGTLDLNDFDWTTGKFSSSNTNIRSIDFGTGEINCSGTGTSSNGPWFTSIATNLTTSGTPVVNVTSIGSTAIAVTSGALSEANSISFNFTGGTYTLTFLSFGSHSARNVDFTGYSGTLSFTSSAVLYGNLTLSSGMSLSSASATFIFGATSGTKTITSNGKIINFPVNFNGVGGSWQLQDAMTLGSTRRVTFTNGTVDLNGFTLTSGTGSTATGTKNITFNGGTLLLSGSGVTAWGANLPNFTTTAGTGTGAISMTSASAKGFLGGGHTYNCNLNQGGAGTLTISSSNTFNDITNSVQPATILFSGNTTQTVSNFTLSGTLGNLIIIDSTSSGQFTLSKASGIVSVSFVDVRDSNATGGSSWQALTANGNVNGGNNTGWTFSAGAVYDVTILESITTVDLSSALIILPASVTEAATGTDQVFSIGSFQHVIDESVTGTDQVSSIGSFQRVIDESATGSELISASALLNISAQESSTASEQTFSTFSFNRSSEETATGADQIFVNADFVSQIDESATGADEVSALGVFKGQIEEFSTGTDEVLAGASLESQIDEAATGADEILAGVDFSVQVDESVVNSDEVVGVVDFGVQIDESATGSDQIFVNADFASQIDEASTGADEVSALGVFKGQIDESATGTDEVLTGINFGVAIDESAIGADEASAVASLGGQIDEIATGADEVAGTFSFGSIVDEAATASDEVSTKADFASQIDEASTASDEISALGVFKGQIDELATGTDEVLAGVIFLVVVLDSSIGLDAVLSASDFTSLVQESTQGQDLVVVVIDFGSLVQEAATGADQSVGFKILGGSVTENATASEIVSVLVDFASNVSESATGVDEVVAGLDFTALAAEVGISLDQVLATGSFQHFINETASGLDAPSSNSQFNTLIQELGIAVDSPLARFLWELINNSQSVSWQNVQSSGATNWQNIPTIT